MHLQDVIYINDKKAFAFLSLFNAEVFADHYPYILFPKIIIISFLPAYPHHTSSDSLDLNKLQILFSMFRYYLFPLCKHPEVPVRISAPLFWEFPGGSYWCSLPWWLSEPSCIHHCNLAYGSTHNIMQNIWMTLVWAVISLESSYHDLCILVCHLLCCLFTSTGVSFLQLTAEIHSSIFQNCTKQTQIVTFI